LEPTIYQLLIIDFTSAQCEIDKFSTSEVLKSKARYLPMFHKKWKKGKHYKPLSQDDISESSEDELFDQRRLTRVDSYED
jgi:hypothetical protein